MNDGVVKNFFHFRKVDNVTAANGYPLIVLRRKLFLEE